MSGTIGDDAGEGVPETLPAPDGISAGKKRRVRAPSRRQIAWTVALVVVVAGVGVAAVTTKNSSAPPTSAAPSTAAGADPTTTVVPIVSSALDAVNLEIALREGLGGCWQNAEPGGADGAYRQDYHHPDGRPCRGAGWDIDVELFATAERAAAAATSVSPGQSAYTVSNALVVVAATADPTVARAVAAQPGVKPVGS